MLNPDTLRSLTAVKVTRGVTIDFYKASLINRYTIFFIEFLAIFLYINAIAEVERKQ